MMRIVTFFDKMIQLPWLALFIPAFVICAILLALLIKQLTTNDKNEWVKVPLLPEQILSISFTGTSLLHVEGPRFSTVFGQLEYSLRGPLNEEQELTLKPVWFRMKNSGLSTERLSVRRFNIERTGEYQLLVSNLDKAVIASDHFIIFSPDKRVKFTLTILGVVLNAVVILFSAIMSIFILRANLFS